MTMHTVAGIVIVNIMFKRINKRLQLSYKNMYRAWRRYPVKRKTSRRIHMKNYWILIIIEKILEEYNDIYIKLITSN